MICPICSSADIKQTRTLYDDRYGYNGLFNLHRCHQCNHLFLYQEFTPQQLSELYSFYYPRNTLSIDDYKPLVFKNSFSDWLNGVPCSAATYVPPNVKVLGIGCGFGQSVGYHAARGCDAYGIEADENVKKVAEHYRLNIKIGLFEKEMYPNNFFDYVTMDQVLEHTENPLKVLRDIHGVLKPEGRLIISIPNAYSLNAKLFRSRWINWHTPYHLQFFSKSSLQILANETDFEISSIKHVTSSSWLLYQWIHLFFCPQHGQKSMFWDGKRAEQKNRLLKRVIIKSFSLTSIFKLNHLITRTLDYLGKGDNMIVILTKKS